jgi:16S rRNA G966 N2-methylase RsmD
MITKVTAETEESTADALAKAAEKVKLLVVKEADLVSHVQVARLEALFVAWDIGYIIETEVIGAYGDGRMAEFAKLCGFDPRTAYNYLYLFRGSLFKGDFVFHPDLPRTYWYALGSSIRWQDDILGNMLHRNILQHPLWRDLKEGETPDPECPQSKQVVDAEKLQTVCKCLKDLRDDLKQDGILNVFEEYDLYVGKPPATLKAMEKLLNDKSALYFSNRDPEEQPLREVVTFIHERISSGDAKHIDSFLSTFGPKEQPLRDTVKFMAESISGGGDKRIDIFFILSFNKGDEDKYTKALEKIAVMWDAISQCVGQVNWVSMDAGPQTKALLEANRLPPEVYKKGHAAVQYRLEKKRRVKEAQQQMGTAQLVEVEQKVICGNAEEVLKTEDFSKRMIDVCLTDPPYGKYVAWRETTAVDYDEPGSAEKAAELVGNVADILVKRELIKEQFIWLSFCPLDTVHIFLPPLLKAFEGLDFLHQVLVWDKEAAGPVGGFGTFSRRAEALLYVNVGKRALSSITVDGKAEEMHPNIFNCRAESKAVGDEYWKPVELLEHLIRLTTGEDDDADANQQLILDPFCGKGSTGEACLNCHRDFRLIDSHQGQYAAAVENVTLAAKE